MERVSLDIPPDTIMREDRIVKRVRLDKPRPFAFRAA